MESKKVKIIDEHNIDREASIICPFTVDQNDYVLYSIDRDQDNSNLFVSKLLKNNDNTSNMMNIEDSMERTKINEIVKKLVTYSLDNGSDVANREIELDGGIKIKVNNVLFNREQNINVSKTYITTVKRSVALVGEKFFNLPEEKPATVVPDSIFTDIPAPAVETAPAEPLMPEVQENVTPTNLEEQPNVDEIMNSFANNIASAETAVPEPVPTPVEPVAAPAPVFEVKEPVPTPVEPAPVVNPEQSAPSMPAPVSEPSPTPAPIFEVSEPAPAPVGPAPVTTPEPTLVFDAKNETNLNNALNSENTDKTVVTSDVDALRTFGTDGASAPEGETAPASASGSKGFVNFKVIAIIGLIVFMAACAFMGYEIYHYIQIINK